MAAAMQKTWLEQVDEMMDGDFVKFEDGEEKILKIVKNPIAGPIKFTKADGTEKTNDGLTVEVLVGENPSIKIWNITSKNLMGQLKGIAKKEGMGSEIAGAIFRVTATGEDLQRRYFLKLLSKPGQQQKGDAWLAGEQKKAAAEAGGQR